jgi:beta-galactosidase
MISSIIDHGKEMLSTPIKPNIWRAPTDNERWIQYAWLNHGFDRLKTRCASCTVESNSDQEIVISTEYTMGADTRPLLLKGTMRYVFAPAAGVVLDCSVSVGALSNDTYMLPRLGVQFEMPEGTEKLSYFGCGPMETYEDKRMAGLVGVYRSTVTDHFEHYVRPQENMAHVETHWMQVNTEAGHGIKVLPANGTETISFNCCHFTPVQIAKTRHDYELVPKKETVVNIDYRNSGIGSNSCGPVLSKPYRIEAGEHRFAFRLLPVRGE